MNRQPFAVGIGLILCIVAVVMFVLAAFWGDDVWSVSKLVALGLAFFAASTRIP